MNIPVLLHHFDIWESTIVYQFYKSDAIIVSKGIIFLKLIATIAIEMNIEEVRKKN